MTPEEFKQRWESNEDGGGITFADIANCAKDWGLFETPKCNPIYVVTYQVLKCANVSDAEDFNPDSRMKLEFNHDT